MQHQLVSPGVYRLYKGLLWLLLILAACAFVCLVINRNSGNTGLLVAAGVTLLLSLAGFALAWRYIIHLVPFRPFMTLPAVNDRFFETETNGKKQVYEWNNIRQIVIDPLKNEVLVKPARGKVLHFETYNPYIYRLLKNIPRDFENVDRDMLNDLLHGLTGCTGCGMEAFYLQKCLCCGLETWNMELSALYASEQEYTTEVFMDTFSEYRSFDEARNDFAREYDFRLSEAWVPGIAWEEVKKYKAAENNG